MVAIILTMFVQPWEHYNSVVQHIVSSCSFKRFYRLYGFMNVSRSNRSFKRRFMKKGNRKIFDYN